MTTICDMVDIQPELNILTKSIHQELLLHMRHKFDSSARGDHQGKMEQSIFNETP